MKIMTIIGARPQFIKAAPVSHAFSQIGAIKEIIVHTGQHFDANMSDIFFSELGVPAPAHHLGIGGGSHGKNTGRMIEAVESVMQTERPDWVLVYGDTDSTLAGSIAASKLHIPLAHVEAGLRSFNMRMPEEINRKLTDHVSNLLFIPSEQARINLIAEGIFGPKVINVGDVMYDAALMFSEVAADRSSLFQTIGICSGEYILATIHRQENTDIEERLSAILEGLASAAWPVVLPIHPRTRNRIAAFGLTIPKNIILIEPLGYLDMIALEKCAVLIATDSGGVQKEAYFHRVPCITLRDETEWVELVELGWNRVCPPQLTELRTVFSTRPELGKENCRPYGNGDAAIKIAHSILEFSS